MKRFIGLIVLSILAAGCTNNNEQTDTSHTQTGQSVSSQKDAQQKLTVISESQDKSVSIWADTNVTGDLLTGLTVKIGDKEKKFLWKNVSNPTFFPEIVLENIDNDSDSEIVVTLTTGYGTEVHQSELHVLKKDLSEFTVQNPIQGIKGFVKTGHARGEGQHTYSVSVNNKSFKKDYKDTEAVQWFDDVVFGNIVRYRVQDKTIIAELPAQVSPGLFIGSVETVYQIKDLSLDIGSVSFNEEK